MTHEAEQAIKHYISVRDAHPIHQARTAIQRRLAEIDRENNRTVHDRVATAIAAALNAIDNSDFNTNQWAKCLTMAEDLRDAWADVYATEED